METQKLYDQTETLLKQKGFKTEFHWAFATGYSDFKGMHPRLLATKGRIAFDIYFDHSPNMKIFLFGGDVSARKPKFVDEFPIENHEMFINYLTKILEELQ